jgi:hypothetical protein
MQSQQFAEFKYDFEVTQALLHIDKSELNHNALGELKRKWLREPAIYHLDGKSVCQLVSALGKTYTCALFFYRNNRGKLQHWRGSEEFQKSPYQL